MALREPLNNMLWEETSVHTGLSWARIVLTFCRVWMSHTYAKRTTAKHTKKRQNLNFYIICQQTKLCKFARKKRKQAGKCYSRWWCSRQSHCIACFYGNKKDHRVMLWESFQVNMQLMITLSYLCECVHLITPGYTARERCHHDPQVSSDTCRWCRYPKPERKRGDGFSYGWQAKNCPSS